MCTEADDRRVSRGGTQLSVVVPARNCAAQLELLLTSLRDSIFQDFEVIVVDDASTDDTYEAACHPGVTVLRLPNQCGPAAARNAGARRAIGDVLCFLDADVTAHRETLGRMAQTFADRPEVDALFGSYDAKPAAQNLISQYRNLLHHHTHQDASPVASTFWAGCGAVRKRVFDAHGGFSEGYARPCIEDIEFGHRLVAAGCQIALCKQIQVTHHKQWTLSSVLNTDLFDRGIPWTRLLLTMDGMPADLNLKHSQRISVVLAFWFAALLLIAGWHSPLAALALVAAFLLSVLLDRVQQRGIGLGLRTVRTTAMGVGTLVALSAATSLWTAAATIVLLAMVGFNAGLYRFFWRERGLAAALLYVPLHVMYFWVCGLAFAIGWIQHQWAIRQSPRRSEKIWLERIRENQYLPLLLAEAASKLLSLVATVLLMGYLGPEGFGTISVALSAVMFLSLLTIGGTDVIAVRAVARNNERAGSFARALLSLRLSLAAALFVLLPAVCLLTSSWRQHAPLLSALGLLLLSGSLSIQWLPKALQKTRPLAIATASTQVLYVALLLVLLPRIQSLWIAPAALAGAETLVNACLWLWLRKRCDLTIRQPAIRLPLLLRQSASAGGSKLVRAGALRGDLLLLAAFVPLTDVGRYAVAYKIFHLCLALIAIYCTVLLPRLASSGAAGFDRIVEIAAESARRLFPYVIAMVSLITIAYALLLPRWAAEFASTDLLSVLLASFVVMFVSEHLRQSLLAGGFERLEWRLAVGALAVHVLAKLILIPAWGVEGAATGTLLGETFYLAGAALLVRRLCQAPAVDATLAPSDA